MNNPDPEHSSSSLEREPAAAPEVLRCGSCGATTTNPDTFFVSTRRHQRTVLCPSCLETRSTRSGRATVTAVVVLFGIGLVLNRTYADAGRSAQAGAEIGTALMYVAAVYLATFVHVVPHELGHAVLGRLLRFRVPRITIGVGAPVLERRIGRTWVDLRSFPVSGVTLGATDERRLLRLRLWLFIAGGPVATFVCTVAAWRLAQNQPDGPARFVLVTLANGGLIVLACALIPVRHGRLSSDGMALLTTPFLDATRLDEMVETEDTTELREHMRRQDHEGSVALSRRRVAKDPNDPDAHALLITNLVSAEDWREAAPAIRDHLARFDPPPDQRGTLLNNLAWIGAVEPDVVSLTEADAASTEALDLAPWNHGVLGTRGSILIELGHAAEGVELVRASLLPSHPPGALAATHAYLAIGTARLGNLWAARGHLDAARSAASSIPGSTSAAVLVHRAVDELASHEVSAAIRTGWVERPGGGGSTDGPAGSPWSVDADPADAGAIRRITARHPDDLTRLATDARRIASAPDPSRATDVIAIGLGHPLPAGADAVIWLLAFAAAIDAASHAPATRPR
jgi:hypothetical protein